MQEMAQRDGEFQMQKCPLELDHLNLTHSAPTLQWEKIKETDVSL